MTAVHGRSTREDLMRQSLQVGGFLVETRRRAWLQLLDLEDLEDQLIGSTLQTSKQENSSHAAASPSLLDSGVALDGEGWQIPRLQHLHQGFTHEDEETSEEWNVARSKRQKRRKRAAENVGGSPQNSTATTTAATNSRSSSRSDSLEDLARLGSLSSQFEVSGDILKEEKRKRRREKKKSKVKGEHNHNREDVEASGILLPSPDLLDEEKDEDWIQTDGHEPKEEHKDEQQVSLDINRSFIGMKPAEKQAIRRDQLNQVIIGVLRKHPSLNYYQGYHDIISVFLLVLIPHEGDITDIDKALEIVIEVSSRVSLHLLRDNMTVNMEPTMGHLKLVRNLLRQVDYPVSVEVEAASALPYFALPWLISLFAHELDHSLSVSVFDYVLARGPGSVIYLAVALIIHGTKDAGTEDAAEKHHSLSQLPSQVTADSLPSILQEADSLSEQHSLEQLGKIMGPRSILSTWTQLPISTKSHSQIPTPWSHADALAEAILSGGTESIVVDALPTPPASDDGMTDKKHDKQKNRKSSKYSQRGTSLLAVVGAVGAVGVAALVMYGAGRSGLSFA